MKLIYLHGLDSGSNAVKACIVDEFCQKHYPDLTVVRPDLNRTPDEVVALLIELIGDGKDTVLMGSSLGGYFACLMSDLTGVPAVLLNPSIRPDVSFQRFLSDNFNGKELDQQAVIYTTTGGWQILYQDLAWFENHRLQAVNADKLQVFLCLGDELLDAYKTQAFFADKCVPVMAVAGGDHRISDFDAYIQRLMQLVMVLLIGDLTL